MIIHSIDAFPLSAPFAADAPRHCFQPAAHFREIPRRGQDAVLVRVRAEDGCEGWGEAWGLPIPQAATACIEDWLAPALIGHDIADVPARWDLLADHLERLGHAEGCGFDALSGIDVACADLAARAAGQPLATFLGGKPQAIRCYAAPVPFRATTAETVADAQALIAAGHRGLKLKVGRGVARDADDVAAVRAAVGSGVQLLVDANAAYDLPTALEVARAIRDADVTWFEDPLRIGDAEAFAHLGAQGGIAVATGEHLHRPRAFAPLIGAVDILVVNVARIGGFGGLRRLREACAGSETQVSFHGVGTAFLQAATVHAAAAWFPQALMEWNVFPNAMRQAVVDYPPQCQSGWCSVPEGVGLGCRPVSEALARFQVPYARRA